ncbi:MAG: hypothetical protein D6808_07750 [Candidatus Dadabacteria bacterium]|nr:MAG: hypothetical protein D6808_07750 [Candidatus Dadabacteria bacterium]
MRTFLTLSFLFISLYGGICLGEHRVSAYLAGFYGDGVKLHVVDLDRSVCADGTDEPFSKVIYARIVISGLPKTVHRLKWYRLRIHTVGKSKKIWLPTEVKDGDSIDLPFIYTDNNWERRLFGSSLDLQAGFYTVKIILKFNGQSKRIKSSLSFYPQNQCG